MEQQNPSFIKNEYAALPIFAKTVIVLGGLTVVFLAGRAIVKGIGKLTQSKFGRDEERQWGNLLEDSKYDETTKQTLSDAEISSIANRLEAMMDGYGTRDADIVRAFKRIRSIGDLAALNKSFGIRTIEAGFGIGWASPTVKGTLSQVLQEDASSSTIAEINAHLASQGINAQI